MSAIISYTSIYCAQSDISCNSSKHPHLVLRNASELKHYEPSSKLDFNVP